LSGISAVAASGTPAQASVASANTKQTITLHGVGLTGDDRVVFQTLDYDGRGGTEAVAPASVAGDGTSLTVVVPDGATTGTVRLARDSAGIVLQIVPTLDSATSPVNGLYNNGTMTLLGTGFAEGRMSVGFGGTFLSDPSRTNGIEVQINYEKSPSVANGRADVPVPVGMPNGPLQVRTFGGTSAP
ncbi:MAG TPA: hypothetical protein PLF63_14095, partial [Rubrivivax sp.]|nr:hypothetical protein [Rubrivivax sp.]